MTYEQAVLSHPSDWRARAARLQFRTAPFIGGAYVASQGAGSFDTINPATGEVLCALPQGCAADVDRAVAAARAAFEEGRWHALPLAVRKSVLLNLVRLIDEHGDELALLDTLEMGKPITSARAEIALSTSFLTYYAEAIDKLYGAVVPTEGHTLGLSLLEPRGVVGAIVPWNFPLANSVVKIAPALAAGNCVVLKPSEISSLSALRLAELAVDAGVPAGVLNVIPGLGATVGEAIARHGDIDFLTFTGSTAIGRHLMACAGQSNGKPLIIECGGKSPQILCADVADDIDAVAAQVVRDGLLNAGQWCAARTRLIIEDQVHDRLVEAVSAAAARLVPGDPLDPETDFGSLASLQQYERVRGFIEQGKAAGARRVLGEDASSRTCAIAPTIFTEVPASCAIAQEEIFGPVLCVQHFSSFDEAIRLANDSSYGLGSTLWTRDAGRIRQAMREIKAGKLVIRSSERPKGAGGGMALGAEPWRASGFGIERGLDGLRAYTRTKAVEWLD